MWVIVLSPSTHGASLDTFPHQPVLFLDWHECDPITRQELVPPHEVTHCSRIDVALTMMCNRVGALVNAVGSEVGRVPNKSCLRFLRGRLRAGKWWPPSVRHDLHRHMPGGVVVNQSRWMGAAIRVGCAVLLRN